MPQKAPRRTTLHRLHVQVTPEQWRWLLARGFKLAQERGGGRMSAAGAVRDLIEKAMLESPRG